MGARASSFSPTSPTRRCRSATSEELRPFLRYFRRPALPPVPTPGVNGRFTQPPPIVRRPTPWSRSFRSGTRISAGLESARRMVLEEPRAASDVLLVSDLNDSLFDVASLEQDAAPLQARRHPPAHRRASPHGREPRLLREPGGARSAFVERAAFADGLTGQSGRPLAGGTPWALIGLIALLGRRARRQRAFLWPPRVEAGVRMRVAAPAGSSRCCWSRPCSRGSRTRSAPGTTSCAATTSASSPLRSTRGCGAGPPGPARTLPRDILGLGDDVRFRKAERLYVRGHLPATTFAQEKARLAARGGVCRAARGDHERRRRAVAASPRCKPVRHPPRRGREGGPRARPDPEPAGRAGVQHGSEAERGADEPRFNLETCSAQLRPNGLIGRDLSQDQTGLANGFGAGLAIPEKGY